MRKWTVPSRVRLVGENFYLLWWDRLGATENMDTVKGKK